MKRTTAVLVIGSFVATSALAEMSPPNGMVQPSAFSSPYQIGLLAASQQLGMGDGEKSEAAVNSQPKKRRYFGTIAGAVGGALVGWRIGAEHLKIIVPNHDFGGKKGAIGAALGLLFGGSTGYLSDRIVERNNGFAGAIIGGCFLSALITVGAVNALAKN